MSRNRVVLRVDATYPLTVGVGDQVRQGQVLQKAAPPENLRPAPASGTIRSIDFEPGQHEFSIVIEPLRN